MNKNPNTSVHTKNDTKYQLLVVLLIALPSITLAAPWETPLALKDVSISGHITTKPDQTWPLVNEFDQVKINTDESLIRRRCWFG